jgi:aminopeptidase
MEYSFYNKADKSQLTAILPWEKKMFKSFNGNIFIYAPKSITHLENIDTGKISKHAKAMKPLREILDKNEDKGTFGWTLCGFTTKELATKAGLPMDQHADQIIKACYLDHANPVGKWEEVFDNANQLKAWLNSMEVRYFHIEGKHIDLRIFPGEQRKWTGIGGHNIPSFELYISPDCRLTEGKYYSNLPSYRDGNYVEGVKLTFKNGKATSVTAKNGAEFTKKYIKSDSNAKKIGEFSLTDKRFSRIDRFMAETLYDENFGGEYGNCHIAVGDSYSDTYDGDPSELTKKKKKELGFNDSCIHWDLVNTEDKIVTAYFNNGKSSVIYEGGMFNY